MEIILFSLPPIDSIQPLFVSRTGPIRSVVLSGQNIPKTIVNDGQANQARKNIAAVSIVGPSVELASDLLGQIGRECDVN